MKKLLLSLAIILASLPSLASAAAFLPVQGGTGFSSVTAGQVGLCLKVLTNSPFAYELGTCGSGGGGGTDGNWVYFNGSGIRLATTTNQVVIGSSATSSLAKLHVTGDTLLIGAATSTGLLTSYTSVRAPFMTATSSTVASTFPLASTTQLSVGSLFYIGGDAVDDLVGAGHTLVSGDLTVNDVTAAMLNAEDFGDFTCNGTTCAVDANAIALGTDTTGNYAATVSSSGSITVGNSGSETAAITVNLNMANANSWTALQSFANASTTLFSSLGPAYFGSTATSSFSTAGALTLVTPLAVTSGGTGASSLNNLIALTTDTTGNYVQSLADDGQTTVTVTNGVAEGGAATLRVIDVVCTGCLGSTEIAGLDISADTNLASTWPIILTNDTLSFGGLSTSSAAVIGNIPYFSGVNTFANVATTSVSCSGSTTCTTFTAIGGSPITISSTGGGGSAAGTWSTTTSTVSGQLNNYSNNTTDIVNIGSTATTTSEFYFDPNLPFAYIGADTQIGAAGSGGKLGIGTSTPYAPLSVVGQIVGEYITATSTTATSTLPRLSIQTGLNLFGTYGQALTDFCVAITGGSGLCDGTDATGAGGSGNVATSTPETAGQLAYWTSTSATPATLGKVATTSLTATSPVALSQPISVIGASASAVSITNDGITDTQLAFNTGQHLTTTSDVTFAKATTTNATTTSFAILGITSSILKTNSLGSVVGISATNTISNILAGSNPVGDGAYQQSLVVDGTNDIFRGPFYVASSTSASIGHHGSFAVPTNCNDSIYSVMIPFTVAVGSGNVVIDFNYASIGGDDTESFDVSAWEESLTVTDAAPSASLRRLSQSFNLNPANIAPGDTFTFALLRDGLDGADTAAGGLLFKDLKFECSM